MHMTSSTSFNSISQFPLIIGSRTQFSTLSWFHGALARLDCFCRLSINSGSMQHLTKEGQGKFPGQKRKKIDGSFSLKFFSFRFPSTFFCRKKEFIKNSEALIEDLFFVSAAANLCSLKANLFSSTLPLAITRWILLTSSSLCPLF